MLCIPLGRNMSSRRARHRKRNMGLEKKKTELLAPAGSVEGFYGAICAGADAVYLGGSRFGARAYAENFTDEELIACLRYAHLLDRKVYLTVNTLFKQSELMELGAYLRPFYEAGLDAVIVQDFGALRFIREHFPGLELHASTQMTLCGSHGAALLKRLGATRIVPARELSLKELCSIKQSVDIELETFIHGAMCYCYSGQCLFSSILGGRSGNRGRCAQPCRLPYTVAGSGAGRQETCYPLSLKDMCTISNLPALIEAGIDSFKIEGRMKKPEYAAGVTALYRRYIDHYNRLRENYSAEEAAQRFRVREEDIRALSALYCRSELQTGYYFRRNGREMVTLGSPAYSACDEKQFADIRGKYLSAPLKLPVRIEASFVTGSNAVVRMLCEKQDIIVEGEPVCAAQKQPVTEENIRKQLGKLGDTFFEAQAMQITVSPDAFYPLKQINELRRRAAVQLEQRLLAARGFDGQQPSAETTSVQAADTAAENTAPALHGYAVSVATLSQLQAVGEWAKRFPENLPKRIYIDGDLAVFESDAVLSFCSTFRAKTALFVTTPYICRESDEDFLHRLRELLCQEPFDGILLRSADAAAFFCEKADDGKKRRADANLYVWNTGTAGLLEEIGVDGGFCLPYELHAKEQRRLLKQLSPAQRAGAEKIVYGRIPLMLTANCVLKTTVGCRKRSGDPTSLVDRYHKKFPVSRICSHCMNIIYNSLPLSLWQEREKWLAETDLRLDFTVETKEQTTEILHAFLGGGSMPPGEYTSGHEKRGVE